MVVPTNEGVYAVVPKDYEIQDLEQYLPKPLRAPARRLNDTDSFIEYVRLTRSSLHAPLLRQ